MIDRMIDASLLMREQTRSQKALAPVSCLSIRKLMLSQHWVPRCSRLGSDLLITQRRPVNFQLPARISSNRMVTCRDPYGRTLFRFKPHNMIKPADNH